MKKLRVAALLVLFSWQMPIGVMAQTLKSGYISRDLNYLPYFIAQKKGVYVKEGIQVDLVSIGRSDIQLQALVAGELHFANINADNIIAWNERTNGNLKVAAGTSNAAPYFLMGAKNIKAVADLKGQKLGVAGLQGGATSILVSYLKSKGLIFPRDYSMIVDRAGKRRHCGRGVGNSIRRHRHGQRLSEVGRHHGSDFQLSVQ
jgi:ABC-type nitrate/sulfonate/bicarbonate transport system substrate-binding protein